MTTGMFPEPRYVETNGVRLAVFEAKPAKRCEEGESQRHAGEIGGDARKCQRRGA